MRGREPKVRKNIFLTGPWVVANMVHGLPANRVHGLPANRVHGLPANRVHGLPANRVHGLPANMVHAVCYRLLLGVNTDVGRGCM